MEVKLSCGHFYGETIKCRELEGLVLTETQYQPGARVPEHSHEYGYVCLIRRGSYIEHYEGRTRACQPMTIAFHPPRRSAFRTISGR